MSENITTSISIKRNKRWFGAGRKAYVLVDDKEIVILKSGELKEFSVLPGTHAISVRFCKNNTKPITVNIGTGENISLEYTNKSHFGINGLCISGLMVLIATIVLESFKIPFIISLLIATIALSRFYKMLENKMIVPPVVVIDESLDLIDAN